MVRVLVAPSWRGGDEGCKRGAARESIKGKACEGRAVSGFVQRGASFAVCNGVTGARDSPTERRQLCMTNTRACVRAVGRAAHEGLSLQEEQLPQEVL